MKPPPEYLEQLWDKQGGKYNWKEDEVALKQFIKEHPEDEEDLLHQLHVTQWMLGKNDECMQTCKHLLEITNDEELKTNAYMALANCYGAKFQTDKEIEYLNKMLELDNESESAIVSLGEVYEQKKEWDKALYYYDLQEKLDLPWAKTEAVNNKATMFYNKKDFDTALGYFKQGVEYVEQQEKEDEQKEKDGAKDSRFHHGVGICLAGKEKWDEAIEWFNKELQLDPQSAEAYYSIGLCWQEQDDFYRAMHNYNEALKLQPEYPEVFNNIAKLFLEHEGDIKKAIEMLEKSIEASGDGKVRGVFYLNLSRIYKTIADYDKQEYYKGKFFQSLGFEIEWREDEDDGDKEETPE